MNHFYDDASTVVCIELQLYWHWCRYDFLDWWDQHIIIFVLVFLERKTDSYATNTLIAIFQFFAYEDFTSAEDIFATLTSMRMLEILRSLKVDLTAMNVTEIAIIVWACEVEC